MISHNQFVQLFVVSILFSSVILSAMSTAEKIETLKRGQSEVLSDIKKSAGGDSTMEYRIGLRVELDILNDKIERLEQIKSKL
jgi:hypothetical protein